MAKQSPHQRVVKEHGSKAALAKKVLEFLTCPEDEDPADFDHRISVMSNTKLLRLFEAQQTLSAKHGSRDKLVAAIVKAKFPGGNTAYETKISTFTTPKLLDLARQVGV
jgi:hypothetical protein